MRIVAGGNSSVNTSYPQKWIFEMQYVSSILLMLVSITNFFFPSVREYLTRKLPHASILGTLLFASGLLGVYSTYVKDKTSAINSKNMNEQIELINAQSHQLNALMGVQVSELLEARNEAKESRSETREAREETKAVRKELAQAQKTISKDIFTSAGKLSTDINQYRTDTSNTVARAIRPGRALGAGISTFIKNLKAAPEPHQIALSVVRGNQEALTFFTEIEQAFKDSGWQISKSKIERINKDANGVILIMNSAAESKLTPSQRAVVSAFNEAGFQMTANQLQDIQENWPIELHIGLQ